jgi:hypothetical protein
VTRDCSDCPRLREARDRMATARAVRLAKLAVHRRALGNAVRYAWRENPYLISNASATARAVCARLQLPAKKLRTVRDVAAFLAAQLNAAKKDPENKPEGADNRSRVHQTEIEVNEMTEHNRGGRP